MMTVPKRRSFSGHQVSPIAPRPAHSSLLPVYRSVACPFSSQIEYISTLKEIMSPNVTLFHENTQALFDGIDLGDVQPTTSDSPKSPESEKYQEFEGPTVLPYRAFQHLHNMHIGPYVITCVKTGESVTKEKDLDFLEDKLGDSQNTLPTETVAVFIPKFGFKVVDEEDGCRFKAVHEAPGARYTYQMVSSRVQLCYYQADDVPRQVAGTCLYPAFHKEDDSLMDHDLVMKRHGFVKLEVEKKEEEEEEEIDIVSIDQPVPFQNISPITQLYNFLQLKGVNPYMYTFPWLPALTKENRPPLGANETPRNHLKRRGDRLEIAEKFRRLDESFYVNETTFIDDSLVGLPGLGSL